MSKKIKFTGFDAGVNAESLTLSLYHNNQDVKFLKLTENQEVTISEDDYNSLPESLFENGTIVLVEDVNLTKVSIDIVNVKSFGAIGDGVNDDSDAILATFDYAFSNNKVVYFPAGSFMISKPIVFKAPFYGLSNHSSAIKALPSFVGRHDSNWAATTAYALNSYVLSTNGKIYKATVAGTSGSTAPSHASGTSGDGTVTWQYVDSFMIDFYHLNYKERKYIKGINFSAQNVVGLKIFGSSSTGGGAGSAQTLFEDLWFTNTHANVYAVGGDSGGVVEAGMLTGGTFLRCTWNGCPRMLKIGSNQDDTVFIGCRFVMPGTPPGGYTMELQGQNCNFTDSYMSLTTGWSSGGIKTLIFVGSFPVKFSGLFLECNSGDFTHVFHCGNPSAVLILENVVHRIVGNSPYVSLIRSQVNGSTNPDGTTIDVRNIYAYTGTTTPVLDVYTNGIASPQSITFRFSGIDMFPNIMQFATGSGGADNANGSVKLFGNFKGKSYEHAVNWTNGVNKLIPLKADGRYGMVTSESNVTIASQVSPSISTFTLPSAGMWLVAVTAKLNGSKDHMGNTLYLVNYYDATNDTLTSENLGNGSKFSAGSGFGANVLTVSAPTTAGVLTITAGWTDGAAHSVVFSVQARKLTSYDTGFNGY
ncbi:MAG: Pectate lyase superfamily protein [Bacillales bacterium]|jgi:hypothetical protein|nr:Pectate lyase superfamily protein [Bacillales bacterium]